ncbi:MAG TPA: sulfotransferase [Geminicoccaceae bacterium]
MRRNEALLAPPYQKDPVEEAFLEGLNASLAEFERAGYELDLPERYPTFHVVGAPRSGTTLLIQLIASSLDIGCINNLIAAFWEAPCCGIRLSRKLLGEHPPASSYRSHYGRTTAIYEPHEFGYFWTRLLQYSDFRAPEEQDHAPIDWQEVRTVITNMTATWGRPIVFKSFKIPWHAGELLRVLEKSCFLWMRRDPVDVAVSLFRMRLSYALTPEEWVSFKPPEYEVLKDLPVHRQVAGQAVYLDRQIRRALDAIGRRNVIEVSYDELCRAPAEVLERVRELAARNGYQARFRMPPPEPLARVRHRAELSPDERLVARHVEDLLEEDDVVGPPVAAPVTPRRRRPA